MAPSSDASQAAAPSSKSLTDVLTTPNLKVELATLIALTSDAMRRDLLTIFEPIANPSPNPDPQPNPSDSLIDFSEDPIPSIEGHNQPSSRPANLARLDQTDISTPRTQGLRRAATTFFDKWQIDVLRRVGEILAVRPETVRQARATAKLKAETAANQRREKAFQDWANGEDEGLSSLTPRDDSSPFLPEGFPALLLALPKDDRVVILDSVLLLLLSLECYTAHSRVLMLRLAGCLRLPESILADHEARVADGLLDSAAAAAAQDSNQTAKRESSSSVAARRWKVGLATVAGAALIGVTGGLAAPILAAGIGGIMGGLKLGAIATLLGPLATNTVLVGGLFGAYGGRMTGRIMEQYTREIKDFKFLPVSGEDSEEATDTKSQGNDDQGLSQLRDPQKRKTHKLRVLIGISGSVTDAEDYIQPWNVFSTSRIESFGLRWEMDALLRLGRKMSEILSAAVWNFASYQLMSMFVAGLWPFGLLSAAQTLDSPFAIAKTRSQKAGRVLAEALINKVQGARPVTLVGYGLGAGVVHSCLLHLAEQNAFGLVESAILMGAAAPSDSASWRRMRAMVTSRLVNVYSADDFLLGLLYRATSAQLGVAGVSKVVGVPGIENFDLTDLIQGHDKYKLFTGVILQRIGFSDLDMNEVKLQQELNKSVQESEEKSRRDKGAGKNGGSHGNDDALAREEADGKIVLVEAEKTGIQTMKATDDARDIDEQVRALSLTHAAPDENDNREDEDNDDESNHRIEMKDDESSMSMIDPTPEPDYGPDQETVRFGDEGRGFNIEWRT